MSIPNPYRLIAAVAALSIMGIHERKGANSDSRSPYGARAMC